ncbi:FAD-dependent thiol oxidase, partial [Cutaneotrichosporon oleaginosum]
QPQRTTKDTHPNLPPGLILGPDGKPCKVCNSWQDWAKMKVVKKSSSSSSSSSSSDPMAMMAAMAGAASKRADRDRSACPPDTADLGRATWTFLHTTAAYYPLTASAAQQDRMRGLLAALPALYPCAPCAADFGADVDAHPPDVSGREGLSRWLCERHNEVNRKLGKREWACDWKTMDARWKDGPADGRCD